MDPHAQAAADGGQHQSLDWAARYRAADTPWDLGGAHPELVALLGSEADPRFRAAPGSWTLVGGAGRGHDALALARAGHPVLAVDLVADLASSLGPALASLGGRFWVGDALSDEFLGSLEREGLAPASGCCGFIFEHTFLCALDPRQRPAWARLMRRLLQSGGRLAALVFPIDKPYEQGGPPHRLETAHIAALLGPEFHLELDRPALHPAAGRQWGERLALFRRESA